MESLGTVSRVKSLIRIIKSIRTCHRNHRSYPRFQEVVHVRQELSSFHKPANNVCVHNCCGRIRLYVAILIYIHTKLITINIHIHKYVYIYPYYCWFCEYPHLIAPFPGPQLWSKEITEGFRCLVTVMGQASPAFEIDNARGPGRGSNGVRRYGTEWGDGGKHQAKSMMDTEKYEEMISKSSEILVYQHNDSIKVSAII